MICACVWHGILGLALSNTSCVTRSVHDHTLKVSRLQLKNDGISILEAMAATGLRAIRYAKEIDGIGTIVANDMDKGAVASIQRNVEFNGVQERVQAHHNDARVLMIQHPQVCVHCSTRSSTCRQC